MAHTAILSENKKGSGRYGSSKQVEEASFPWSCHYHLFKWLWRGKVYADWTYRGDSSTELCCIAGQLDQFFCITGKPLGTYLFSKQLDRSDWKLIHKHEENDFCKCENPFTVRRIPTEIPLPPLQRFIHEVNGFNFTHDWGGEYNSENL